MLKQITFVSLVALSLLSCKTKKVTVKDKTPPNTVEINYGDKTGATKFLVLQSNAIVRTPVSFIGVGVGEAYMCSNNEAFGQIFYSTEANAKLTAPINFSNSRLLAIVGQTTEYKTNYTVKSTYQSAEGYTIRIQENMEPNKSDTKMTPYILLEIPNTYSQTKFIVYIDQKQIPVVNR